MFYNTKDMHKLLVQQSYNDVKLEYEKINKHPVCKGYNISDNYNNLSEPINDEWNDYKTNTEKLKKIFMNNLLCYCHNYPHEKISKNRYIIEYKEYPWRLEQNISIVILDL